MNTRYLLWITGFCLMPSAFAGVIVTTNEPEGKVTQIYQKNQMVMMSDGKAQMIIDAKKDVCININHHAKKYLKMSCRRFIEMTKSLMSGVGDMAKQMQSKMPPEMRAQMNSMQRMPPLSVKKVGSGKHSGFKVEKYRIIVQGETLNEYWVSAEVNKLIQSEVNYSKFKDLLFDDKDFLQGPMAMMMDKVNKKAEEIYKKGFVLKEMSYLKRGPNSPPEVTESKVEKKTVDIKRYYPPKNFKQVQSLQELMF